MPETTSESRVDSAVITVRNPADGTVVGSVANSTADEVAAKVCDLRRNQPAWEALGPKGRKVWLIAFQDWILDNAERIADVLQSESGKTRADASLEAPIVAECLGYYAKRAHRFLADDNPRPYSPLSVTKKLAIVYRPHQVVGVISPWNAPFLLAAVDAVGALAAGAAVLIKPSEVTPLSALLLAEGWREIGAPPILSVLTGAGATGAALVDNVDFVQFTGSARTGRLVGTRAVERLIPFSLELGGKDPAIVLADADIERAVNAVIWGGLVSAGQTCIAVERVYVEAPVYEEFVDILTQRVAELRQGQDDSSYGFDIGAMATKAQSDVVDRHVKDAVAAGAHVLIGGRPTGTGTFYEPTVLTDVDHSMACMTEETFGPTIPVMKVADEDEAIRLANDSSYGLSATVFTGDVARGRRIARRLETGSVNINDVLCNLFQCELPHGGWKESGMGARLGGAYGLRKFCRLQGITEPRFPSPTKELAWFPVSQRNIRLALGVLRAGATHGIRRFGVTPRGRR